MKYFKDIIEKRLYKLYPFCEVTITGDFNSRSTGVMVRWFYHGKQYNYKELYTEELFSAVKPSQENVAEHFVEKAIHEIQSIIFTEDRHV